MIIDFNSLDEFEINKFKLKDYKVRLIDIKIIYTF